MQDLRDTVKQHQAAKTEDLIQLLNSKIRGWANYYRHYCSKRTFGYISNQLFPILCRWAKKRHQRKGVWWIMKKYFHTRENRRWQFTTEIKKGRREITHLDLVEISHTPIRRHVKILAEATPYDPAYGEYFRVRQTRRKEKRLFFPCKSQWSAWWEIQLNWASR